MSANDFYRVHDLQFGDQSLSCRLQFHAEHDIFRGHFPGQPVVPGVCMMQIVRELLEQCTGKPQWLERAPQVKFLQLILPDTEPLVTVTWKETDGTLDAQAVFRNEEAALFKMMASFRQ